MKRTLFSLISLLMILSCFVSCKKEPTEPEIKNREYVESEVLAAASELLLKSNQINAILWGVGLPTSQSEDAVKNGAYIQMDPEASQTLEIFCVDDVRTLCKTVYSSDVCQMVERTVFSPVKDGEGNVISLVRYYDYTPKDETNAGSLLMIHQNGNVYFKKDVLYHTDTIFVKEVRGEKIYLCAEVTVYNEDNQSQKRTLTFSLIEEKEGWRLCSPTYMAYINE